MLEETGIVVGVEEGQSGQSGLVWVQTEIKTTCGKCQARDNCSTGAVARTFSPKPNVIGAMATDGLEVKVGDSVVIAIDENFVVLSAFYVYMLPIIGFMLFAGLTPLLFTGSSILSGFGLFSDFLSALFSFLGGWLGYLLARHKLRQTEPGSTSGTNSGANSGIDSDKPCRNDFKNGPVTAKIRVISVNSSHIPITFSPK